MPNATLCGKAVVEMLLARYEGKDSRNIQQQLVENGGLPQAYTISEERFARCRKLDSVEVQDRNEEAGMAKGWYWQTRSYYKSILIRRNSERTQVQ